MLPQSRQTEDNRRRSRAMELQSRGARWRLFVLVAALMTVLVAMNEARKPGTWAWMWGSQHGIATPERVDTKVPLQPGDVELPGSVIVPRSTASLELDPTKDSISQGWGRIWYTLDHRDKAELARIVQLARLGKDPSQDDAVVWEPLVKRLDTLWNSMFAKENQEALQPNSDVPAESRQRLLESLTAMEIAWNNQFKPAFESAKNAIAWNTVQRQVLAELDSTILPLALEDVRDDTVWRPDDKVAWFRLIENLQSQSASQLEKQSKGKVDFVQIFRQAHAYRGEVVTVEGTARLVYRVQAPKNVAAVENYYLFWIQPADGSNLPIVVYALDVPEGFPKISTEHKKISEPVVVTGYFFKRWVYRAADGLNSVPLVVTKIPHRVPMPEQPRSKIQLLADQMGPKSWTTLISVIAFVAGLIVWLIYRSSRPSQAVKEIRKRDEAVLERELEQLPDTESIEEGLKKLEQSHPDQEGRSS